MYTYIYMYIDICTVKYVPLTGGDNTGVEAAYLHIYIYIYIYMYTYIHIYTYICINVHTYINVYTFVHKDMLHTHTCNSSLRHERGPASQPARLIPVNVLRQIPDNGGRNSRAIGDLSPHNSASIASTSMAPCLYVCVCVRQREYVCCHVSLFVCVATQKSFDCFY